MSFKPPQSAINNAKRGLKLRQEWGRGGLSPAEAKAQGIDSGVTRARKIASGTVSEHDVRRMSAFNRHRKNYRPDKKMPDGGPTAGTIAWLLWGGTSGVNWAKKKSAAMNAEGLEPEEYAPEMTDEEMEEILRQREAFEEELERLQNDPEYTTLMDSEEKKRTTIYFPDGSTMETYTDYTIEEHRELAEPHNEHYDYLKYLETTSDSRIKTFKEWLMYEISKDYQEWFSTEEDEPELKKYMVSVPALHYYGIGPVEAYDEDEAVYEVKNNWRYWRGTIDDNGDWGGPTWRYYGIDINEPEAYEFTEYDAEYKTMRKDEIGQLVSATKACLDALNDCLEDDGRFNMDEYDALWATHPILADLESKRFQASGLTMPAGFQETDDYYSDDGAHIITAEIPFLAPKGYYISDMEFHNGHIEVIFISEDNKTFDADWRDLPRDSKGRWMSNTPKKEDSEPKVSTYSRSMITLRDLTEQLQESLGLTDFNSAYFTVQQMLDAFPGGDSDEARRALRNTIEDTRMVLEYDEAIDYPTHIQIMADIYRESGDVPPEQYEEAVFNRIAFEDEFASDYYEHPMSNMPYGHPMQEKYQEMLEEWDLDGDPPSFEEWLEQEEEYDRQLQEYEGSKEYERAMEDWEKALQEDYEMQQKSASESFNAERRVKPNLPVPSPDYTYSETFGKNIVLLSEDDEDEGPTVEDFFRDVEKLFNKYGEFSWDSEQHDDGLAISCFLVPWNGAYNFFQYDEDFSQYRDE